MTLPPSAGYLSDDLRTQGEVKTALENFLQSSKELLGGTVESTLTIATGAIVPTGGCHAVDTEAGASIDDLTTVAQTNHPDGRMLLLRVANAARAVTVKHAAGGTGQIALAAGADRLLRQVTDWLLLKRTGTLWEEVPLGSGVPTGAIIMWAVDVAPPVGYLALDGSAISRTAYPALWLHYGTRHGAGDGSTTFNLPRMIGRIPIALDVTQTDFNTTGKTGGATTHTLSTAELPSHSHTVSDPGHVHAFESGGQGAGAGPTGLIAPGVTDMGSTTSGMYGQYTGLSIQAAGGGGAHSILNPYFVVQFCVKT